MLIDSRHGPRIAPGLTNSLDKADLYSTDSYFWEGWEDFESVAGAGACDLANDHTLILLKPDAVVARRLELVIDWLLESGFAIVAANLVTIDRHTIRLLWQYQWNIARRERKDACDLLLSSCPSLMLIARRPTGSELPAATMFALLKGPADPALRAPSHLRYHLGRRSTLLNFVHSADEAADLVRELAICMPAAMRSTVLRQMQAANDGVHGARELVQQLYAQTPAHSLLLADSFAHVANALKESRGVIRADKLRSLEAALEGLRTGESPSWRRFFAAALDAAVAIPHWDQVTIASHLITMDYDSWEVLLPGVRVQHPNPTIGKELVASSEGR